VVVVLGSDPLLLVLLELGLMLFFSSFLSSFLSFFIYEPELTVPHKLFPIPLIEERLVITFRFKTVLITFVVRFVVDVVVVLTNTPWHGLEAT
jgi:hypothetical protein